jgi:hypothetical protein
LDKREAIRRFVKQNSAIFRMDPFPGEAFKKTKREFFVERSKMAAPRDTEIAGETLEVLITTSQIKNEADLNKMFAFPFFRDKIQNKEYYLQRLLLQTQGEAPIVDAEKMKDADYAEKYTEYIKKKALDEVMKERESKIEELDEKIRTKKEEYLSMPSILDGEDYPIPEVEESVEEIIEKEREYLPWWDKLGLTEEPFHELEGLDKIDKQMWEQVVHKTELFRRYEQTIEKTPAALFKNTVLYGQFGAGKTTFFDYIQPKLYAHRIYPIYIQLGGEYEVRELIFEFKRRLSNELFQLYRIIVGYGSHSIDSMDDQTAIVELFGKLTEHGAQGFIVFIDDLHKGDLDKAMKFMSHLQVITSQISRASTKSLKLGFYVAGHID